MNREETLATLNQLMIAFETMKSAPIVSISKVEKSCDWELQVKWIVGSHEKTELLNFAHKHGLTMREKDGCTFFR